MQVEKFEDLIGWTRDLHSQLSECLSHCASESDQMKAKWLLEYLASHEATLAEIVSSFEKQADIKVLRTWFYDYLQRKPIAPHAGCDSPYANMEFDEVCRSIFGLHNQLMDLYRHLLSRAEIPAVRELLEFLLDLEEHETKHLARQTNRMRSL